MNKDNYQPTIAFAQPNQQCIYDQAQAVYTINQEPMCLYCAAEQLDPDIRVGLARLIAICPPWSDVNLPWYENIEPGIRALVKLLRNNGFNTTCSCEHGKYIEGTFIATGELFKLHKLIYDYCDEQKLAVNYGISFNLEVTNGIISLSSFIVKLSED